MAGGKISQSWRGSGDSWNFVTFAYLTYKMSLLYTCRITLYIYYYGIFHILNVFNS